MGGQKWTVQECSYQLALWRFATIRYGRRRCFSTRQPLGSRARETSVSFLFRQLCKGEYEVDGLEGEDGRPVPAQFPAGELFEWKKHEGGTAWVL